jgi:hypothetical protein
VRVASTSEDKLLKVRDLETPVLVKALIWDATAHRCTCAGNHRIVAGDQSGRVNLLILNLKADS